MLMVVEVVRMTMRAQVVLEVVATGKGRVIVTRLVSSNEIGTANKMQLLKHPPDAVAESESVGSSQVTRF